MQAAFGDDQTDLRGLIRTISLTIGTFCLLVWLNILAPDAALLTSKYTVSVPAAPGTTAEYPVFLIVAAGLLFALHIYLHVLTDRWLASTGSLPDEVSLVGSVYHLRSRVAQKTVATLMYFLCPLTLVAAAYKAMALPMLGIPVTITAIGCLVWTGWLLFRRFLDATMYSLSLWRVCFIAIFLLTGSIFVIYSEHFVRPMSLFRADLSGAYLAGLTLDRPDLSFANLHGATLADSQFSEAQLRGADLEGALLDNVVFLESNFDGAILKNTRMQQSIIWHSDAKKVDFTHAKLNNVEFAGTNLDNSSFAGARVVCSSFQDSNYSSAKKLEVLSCTSFSLDDSSPLKQNDVRLSPVALISKIKSTESERTSISHANFTWAVLQDVLLSETFLAGSDLRGARFLGSYLESVTFDGADLKGAMFWRTRLFDTTFQNADLSGSLWRGSIGVDMDVTGATVGGVSIVGSRLVATTVARTTAKAGGEDILESILEVDDDSRYRARWRGVVGPALLKGANPFPSKETGEESICEIGIMGTADNCVTEEDARQRRARRFVEIACGDSTNVPVRWWSAPSVMTERQRSEYLKKSIDVLLRRDEISLDKEVEDASGEAKNVVPSPAWVRELAGRILDKGCEKPKDALSKEDQAALEEQIGPAK